MSRKRTRSSFAGWQSRRVGRRRLLGAGGAELVAEAGFDQCPPVRDLVPAAQVEPRRGRVGVEQDGLAQAPQLVDRDKPPAVALLAGARLPAPAVRRAVDAGLVTDGAREGLQRR